MEYAAPVWDPYYNTDIYKLKKVQRRAARWILSDYSRNSVMSLLSSLSIPTLQQRRQSSRLTLFYKIINNTLRGIASQHLMVGHNINLTTHTRNTLTFMQDIIKEKYEKCMHTSPTATYAIV